jgi:uncharacterized membrane protein (UPF0182 family)
VSYGDPPTVGPGGSGPYPFRNPRDRIPRLHLSPWLVVIVALIVLFSVASIAKGIYAEYLWFDSLGYASIYGKEIVTKVWLFFAGSLLFLTLIGFNLWLARRLSPSGLEESFIAEVEPATLRRIVSIVAVAGSLFLAVVFGSVAAGEWDTVLRAANGVSFGTNDPAFGRDAGFYVFTLPVLRFVQGWLLGAVIVVLLGVIAAYAFSISLQNFEVRLSRAIRAHVGVLLIALLAMLCFGFVLSIFDLAVSKNGFVQGATYTDLHAREPGYYALIILSVVAAAGVVWTIFHRGFVAAALGGAIWVVGLVIFLGIYPAIVQRFSVDPNELAKEQPYIARNIAATRGAYGLQAVDEQDFAADSPITASAIDQNQDTINNIRIWDPRFLLDTVKQQQEIRPLYVFDDIDVDRYLLNGQYTEVTLSGRELTEQSLPADARGWVNVHTQYTHGYGAVMNPANKVDAFGLPVYNILNIPPSGQPAIDQPRIYFGQRTDQYVIVGAKTNEFDYETDQGNLSQTRYTANSGVGIGSLLRRFVYSWEFGDLNILISGQITGQSRLLYRRTIDDRISHIAPFLTLDHDPYLVVADGRLVWMQDAYTTTDGYPYSQDSGSGFNYIRNSVKITMDAYTGDVTFYLADANDPIARTYQRIFPKLLKPLAEMPASLKVHIRYPEDLFKVQADLFRTYHMTDPRVFYNKEDLWDTPFEGSASQPTRMDPYYVIMRLPGETTEEFVLIRPFTPFGKPNAVAWMGARSDGANYGKLSVFRFPSGKQTPGPAQVESSIDSQTDISKALTLLNQQGSKVKRGNLLMIPIDQSYLYVEPVYLQADQNPRPAVIGVVAYSGETVYLEPTLGQTLRVVLRQAPPTYAVGAAAVANAAPGSSAGPSATPSARGSPGAPTSTAPSATPTAAASAPSPGNPPSAVTPTATDIPGLIREASDADAAAQERLRNGDFAGYGQQEARLRAALSRLNQLIGQPGASPTPQP